MMHDGSLDDLLWRFSSGEDDARIVGPEEIGRWPWAMLAELKRLALIVEHSPANRVACPACELGHVEDLQFSGDPEHGLHAVIPCPVFGRVEIEDDALRRWRLRDDELTTHLQGTEDRAGSSEVVTWDGTTLTVNRELLTRSAEVGEPHPNNAYVFKREGNGWLIAFGGTPTYCQDAKGMGRIHRLLQRPNEWLFMADMVSLVECGLEHVDRDTLKELRRLAAAGDASRSDLKAFLSRVTRLDGTPRRSAGAMTRAVNATRNSIDRAIGRIRKSDAALANHLDRTIKKGLALSYQTELDTLWET